MSAIESRGSTGYHPLGIFRLGSLYRCHWPALTGQSIIQLAYVYWIARSSRAMTIWWAMTA